MAKYIMLNSEIIHSSEPCLLFNNRGFLFGDSFSFQMRGNSSKAFLSEKYFDYMISVMKLLGMERPLFLKRSIFETDLELLLQKNRIYKGFSAIVSVFRNGNNFSRIAAENSISILMSVETLPEEYYSLNEKGLKIGIYKKNKIDPYIFQNNFIPGFNFDILLKNYLIDNDLDEALLIDKDNIIVKAIDSNVLFVKNGHLVVPINIINNYQKVFTQFILETALKLRINVISAEIREADLVSLDEIFLVNPVFGIKWVVAYKEKRYYNKISLNLLKSINKNFIQS
ncbi:MAG: aminotransferase class IV [Bacteroidales bacterium]|nr:aminotransferase class IV [Bacteroidales bacterium]